MQVRRLVLLLFLSGCATHNAPEVVANPYGFLWGILHGMVWPFALLANLVSWFASLFGASVLDGIQLIGRPNTGVPYYIGFVVGLSAYGEAGSDRRRQPNAPD